MWLPSLICVSRIRVRENGYSLQSDIVLRIAPCTRIKTVLGRHGISIFNFGIMDMGC